MKKGEFPMSKLMDKILEGLEYMVLQEPEVDIFTGMEHDSRKITEGNIFVALEGDVVDGHSFIDMAIQKDRKSTRLNSSHANISYAVFCLKKKKITLVIHLKLKI